MKARKVVGVLLGAAVSVGALVVPAGAQGTVVGESTAYQVDARHDGSVADSMVAAPPLTKKWSRDLGGSVSYPIVAGGRVFVTAKSPSGHETTLYAVNARTGKDAWAPVSLGGTRPWSALAYGGGRLYALNYDGVMTAFDPATGVKLWTATLPRQSSFTSAPTYAAGVVYTGGSGSGGTLYAVNAATGAVLWTQQVENGDESSPAVTANGVYVSYACEQTYAFDPTSGSPIWHHDTDCEGGGGSTPVLADGGVWVRDAGKTPTVLNAGTGAVRGTYTAAGWSPAPAFDGSRGYFVDGGVLQERDAPTLAAGWTFKGDGQLTTAPIVVNGYVYVGSHTGQLWALNGTTGKSVWSTSVGAPINAPDENNVSQPLTGLGAGDGVVIVPATNLLVAYGQPVNGGATHQPAGPPSVHPAPR